MLALTDVGVQGPQATDEDRHLRRRQRQQLRPVDQRLLGRHELLAAKVIAKPISGRFERREGGRVRLLRGGVHAPRRGLR